MALTSTMLILYIMHATVDANQLLSNYNETFLLPNLATRTRQNVNTLLDSFVHVANSNYNASQLVS